MWGYDVKKAPSHTPMGNIKDIMELAETDSERALLRSITSRAAKGEYVVPSESESQQLAAILRREPFYKDTPEDILVGVALSYLI
jgi:hypothetical protein